jgi:FkbM family methyltransferase
MKRSLYESAAQMLRTLQVAVLPTGLTLSSKLANGAIVLGSNRKGHGGRGVYIYRDCIEADLCPITQSIIRAGDVFIDVGANTGVYSLSAAKTIGSRGVVLSVEPNVHMASWLQRSVELNNFSNVRIRNFALGESIGIADLYTNYRKPNSFSLNKIDEFAGTMSVQITTLDELVFREKLNRVDFIKIDAEGAEGAILNGAKETINAYRPSILVEVVISDVNTLPPGYSKFRLPGSPNSVLSPTDSEIAKSLVSFGYFIDMQINNK